MERDKVSRRSLALASTRPRSADRRRVALVTTLVLVTLGAGISVDERPASAVDSQGRHIESIDEVFDMLVTDELVLLSDPDGNRVAVTDHTGTELALLKNIPGASGMALDGDTLYVAALQGERIERFDLTTNPPTRLTAWDTSSVGGPYWLAVTGGFLWFTDCREAVLGRVRLTTGNVTDRTPDGYDDLSQCPKIEWSPYAPDVLVIYVGPTYDPVRGYDVSSGLPVEMFDVPSPEMYAVHLEILPGGTEWVASSWNYAAESFALGDFDTPTATYEPEAPSGYPGEGLAVTDHNGGMIAAVYGRVEWWEPDVQLWKIGEETPFRTFSLLNSYDPYDDAVEFSPDGTRLFIATPGVGLHILDPRRKETVLELSTDLEWVDYGDRIVFNLSLAAGDAERTVKIWGDPKGTAPKRLLKKVEVPQDGSIRIRSEADVSMKYSATFAGDDLWEPASTRPLLIHVRHVIRGRMLRADGQDGHYAVYRSSSRVYYKAVGKPVHPGRTFKIMLERRSDGRWRDFGEARFEQNDNGVVVIYIRPGGLRPGRYAFQSWYGTDKIHEDGYSNRSLFLVR